MSYVIAKLRLENTRRNDVSLLKVDYDLKYIFQFLDVRSYNTWLYPLKRNTLSDQFNDIDMAAEFEVKANTNSYIQLQTAAIFFLSSLYLKQGIDPVYVMVGFICKG